MRNLASLRLKRSGMTGSKRSAKARQRKSLRFVKKTRYCPKSLILLYPWLGALRVGALSTMIRSRRSWTRRRSS